jgi:hypothetical protein
METRHLLSISPETSDESEFEITESKEKLDLASLADFLASQSTIPAKIPTNSRRGVTLFISQKAQKIHCFSMYFFLC